MNREKPIAVMTASIIIVTGFLSFSIDAAEKPQLSPKVFRVVNWISFPGKGKASYEVDPVKGCIQNFYYENGKLIKPKRPGWLREGKKTVDFGSFTDSQCRQGVIGIGGSPIEYWGYANGYYYCIGAYDPACPAWYQPCRDQYPSCP